MQCWEAGGSSTSPDRWSTGLAVLAGLESTPMRSCIPSVEGIRAELTSVERIRSRAWCKPDMVQGMVQAGYGPGHGASQMVDQEQRGERTNVCRALGMAPARR
jgi:hypothetical protein